MTGLDSGPSVGGLYFSFPNWKMELIGECSLGLSHSEYATRWHRLRLLLGIK